MQKATVKLPKKITLVSIEKLIPYVRNARTHSDSQVAQLAASMKEYGWTNPILLDETGGIIAGHGRVMAARKLELTEVPAIVLEGLTDVQKRALILADNQLALTSGWDINLLKLELQGLKDSGYNLDLLGFSPADVDDYLNFDPTGLDDPESEPPEEKSEGSSDVVSYTLKFASEDDKDTFTNWLRKLAERYPDIEHPGTRVAQAIEDDFR
ncbi:MAG: ParB/Srx family N-terminal domain-containing protein [Candidatus Obscuribacterales bacterium]|nr:ParB/Srx family N-terminal domain-containing protein [Candidatus Obscuribacterales bacterium]